MSASDSIATAEYRPVDGFPGYRVGNDGTVWSCWKRIRLKKGNGHKLYTSDSFRQLKPGKSGVGYLTVCLYRNKTGTTFTVHRLVLDAFVGPRPPKHEACHGDGDKTNNRLENLRWDMPHGNHADRAKHGVSNRGSRNGFAKLTEKEVLEIRKRRSNGESCDSIAAAFNVSARNVRRITSGKTWKYAAETV